MKPINYQKLEVAGCVDVFKVSISKAELMRRPKVPKGYEVSELTLMDGCRVVYKLYRLVNDAEYDNDDYEAD